MTQPTALPTCTNPNYGQKELSWEDTHWWTTHEACEEAFKCVCLYPLSPDGAVAKSGSYVPPDYTKLTVDDFRRLPKDLRTPALFLIDRYGLEVLNALALKDYATFTLMLCLLSKRVR